jgi:hypothetical protein
MKTYGDWKVRSTIHKLGIKFEILTAVYGGDAVQTGTFETRE